MDSNLSVSNLVQELVNKLINNSKEFNILIKKGPFDCTIIDAGIEIEGSKEAGKLIAEICMGGLGQINLEKNEYIYHAGTKINNNKIYSNGGRVLNFVSLSKSFKESRIKIINLIKLLNWSNGFFRKDIGYKVIND